MQKLFKIELFRNGGHGHLLEDIQDGARTSNGSIVVSALDFCDALRKSENMIKPYHDENIIIVAVYEVVKDKNGVLSEK